MTVYPPDNTTRLRSISSTKNFSPSSKHPLCLLGDPPFNNVQRLSQLSTSRLQIIIIQGTNRKLGQSLSFAREGSGEAIGKGTCYSNWRGRSGSESCRREGLWCLWRRDGRSRWSWQSRRWRWSCMEETIRC